MNNISLLHMTKIISHLSIYYQEKNNRSAYNNDQQAENTTKLE